MDLYTTNEVKLVNGIGYNLARLIVEDHVDFQGYVDLTRKIISAYLKYNKNVTPAKVGNITQQKFTNQVNDYITRHDLDVDNHLFMSKAHVLYFLGYGGSLEENTTEIKKIIKALDKGLLTHDEARKGLDALVIVYLNSLKNDVSKAIRLVSQDLASAHR